MWPFASIVIVINYRITVVLSTSAEITKNIIYKPDLL